MSFTLSICYAIIAAIMFLLSIPIFIRGIGQSVPTIFTNPLNKIPESWLHKSQDLHIVGSYGLFRSMTGVGGRPEVIYLTKNFNFSN